VIGPWREYTSARSRDDLEANKLRWLGVILCVFSLNCATEIAQAGIGDGRALLMHADGSYETAYAWSYGGNVAPDYGAFAERYEGSARIDASSSISQPFQGRPRAQSTYMYGLMKVAYLALSCWPCTESLSST
jgi:hypothetical protein